MKLNAFLMGEKVCLKPLTENELDGNYVNWLNDEMVCQFNAHHVLPYTREQASRYIQSVSASPNTLVLAVYSLIDDIHIGNISLGSINYTHRSAEFAILMGEKSYWGKGFAKEAACLLVHHGFETMNLHRIYCGTNAENIGMQKLALYLGMQQEGLRREALYKHGRYVDIIDYGVLRHEFRSKFSDAVLRESLEKIH